ALAVAGSAIFPTGEVHDHPREILAYVGLHGFSPQQTVTTIPTLTGPPPANTPLSPPTTTPLNDIFVRYIRPKAGNQQVLLVSRATVVLLGLWALYQGLHTESVLKKSLYA